MGMRVGVEWESDICNLGMRVRDERESDIYNRNESKG